MLVITWLKIGEKDMLRPVLTIDWNKSDATPKHERLHLGFGVDLSAGLFIVPYCICSLLIRIILFVSRFSLFIGPEVLLMLVASVLIGV